MNFNWIGYCRGGWGGGKRGRRGDDTKGFREKCAYVPTSTSFFI